MINNYKKNYCIKSGEDLSSTTFGKVKSGAGFTLIEMLVAMLILISIMGLGMFLSMDYYRSYIFYYEKDLAISILQKARSQSLANINQSWHGVKIGASEYIIFEGNDAVHDYNHRDTAKDTKYEADKTIALSGMSEVVFTRLIATSTPVGGDLTLSDGIRSAIISINNEGRINQN